MGAHAEFLRVSLNDDSLARAVIADPRALADRAADPVHRAIVRLVARVTEMPWALSRRDHTLANEAGLDDASILHVVLLSAYFGHLNRVADAVGIELDYNVAIAPVHAEPATPPYLAPQPGLWPDPNAPRTIDLVLRPGASQALAAWRAHALEREAPLSIHQRAVIARAVAERLGDAAGVKRFEAATPNGPLEQALVILANEVTLAPWALGSTTIANLRRVGLVDDRAIFDAISVATSSTTFSRIEVALSALARD
ncbi:MAG: hypothetical protein JST54_11440 [Deltaproteobacteria bacterium]|nr:hypothetical protein [Deltaproteobacteria bacterium]